MNIIKKLYIKIFKRYKQIDFAMFDCKKSTRKENPFQFDKDAGCWTKRPDKK